MYLPDSMTDAIDEFVYKLVLLGEASVGKSSLVVRFVQDQFHNHIESTIGAAFFTKSIPVDGDDVTFEIWDTAGQERYHSLAPMYYRGAKAAIVVYDVTDPASYDRAHKWVDELKSSGGSGTVITLVGNKVRCCWVATVLLHIHRCVIKVFYHRLTWSERYRRTRQSHGPRPMGCCLLRHQQRRDRVWKKCSKKLVSFHYFSPAVVRRCQLDSDCACLLFTILL